MFLHRGIGNLIGMPLAYAVGRRVVLLGSTIIMILAAGVAAGAQNFEWHLAARMVLGLAAGQSEALVPMITQVRNRYPAPKARPPPSFSRKGDVTPRNM